MKIQDGTYSYVEALADSEGQQADLLELFAFGDYSCYEAHKEQYPTLSSEQLLVLIKLSIISLVNDFEGYSIPFDDILDGNMKLAQALTTYDGSQTPKDLLQRIIIDMVSEDVIVVRIDEHNSCLKIVKSVVLRDAYAENYQLRVLTEDEVERRSVGKARNFLQSWMEEIKQIRQESTVLSEETEVS